MAIAALQMQRQVQLVAVENGLPRRGMLGRIVRDHLCFRLWLSGTLSAEPNTQAAERGKNVRASHKSGASCIPHVQPTLEARILELLFSCAFLITSSMLVPKSLSITMAALRPGAPVTEPPG